MNGPSSISERRPSIAYVADLRFPGGTSSALASEVRQTARLGHVSVNAISSAMFKGEDIAPQLADALDEVRISPVWNPTEISADIVIVQNPAFLKFQDHLPVRIIARHLIVVTHENFLRPGGVEAFDVAGCLRQIDAASVALRKSLAPVSPANRSTVTDWIAAEGLAPHWSLLPWDWFNICDFPRRAPAVTAAPRDRRGRLSRPGFEKFPDLAAMDHSFPAHAAANVILGADTFLDTGLARPHWQMFRFRQIEVERFFGMIDFMVYFTAPTWRESFGRVLAEGLAAGKVVISDPATAAIFDGAVIAATPADTDAVIKAFIDQPALYHAQVTLGQTLLDRFSGAAFAKRFQALTGAERAEAA